MFIGSMFVILCMSSNFSCGSALWNMKRNVLFSTFCIFIFCVLDAHTSGIGGYSSMGRMRVSTNVVFIPGVRLTSIVVLEQQWFC